MIKPDKGEVFGCSRCDLTFVVHSITVVTRIKLLNELADVEDAIVRRFGLIEID